MNVDYDKIAAHYDRHRHGGGPYLDRLIRLAAESNAHRVLELGAGTGLNTEAFLRAYPCRLTALELSSGMIAKAQAKEIPAAWVQGSAYHMPLADASVESLFSIYVLHHLRDLDAAFRECARVLRSGTAAFVTASHAFIGRHPMNRYFPSFAKVDKARFQTLDEVEAALARNGFTRITIERYVDAPRPIDEHYVERVAQQFISTYALLPPDEFEEGVRRLRADVARMGRLDVDIVWESVAIWGAVDGRT